LVVTLLALEFKDRKFYESDQNRHLYSRFFIEPFIFRSFGKLKIKGGEFFHQAILSRLSLLDKGVFMQTEAVSLRPLFLFYERD
jgi:hypothetical protein